MKTGTRRCLAAVLLATALAGCATTAAHHRRRRVRRAAPPTQASAAGPTFPSRAELAGLMSARAPTAPPSEPTALLERSELDGPLPEAVGARLAQDTSPLGALLRVRAERTGGRVRVTEAMQCVARELGRYLLRREGRVPPPFADFVLGRCGAMSTVAMTALVRGTMPPRGSDAELVRHLDAQLGEQADALLRLTPGAVNVGASLVRDGLVDGRIAGLLWSSYAFYDDAQTDAEVAQVRRDLDAQRRAVGVEPAQPLDAPRPMLAAGAAPAARGAVLGSALQAMLDRAVPATALPLRGWVIPTMSLDAIAFPPELVRARGVRAFIHVVHRHEPGAAWGHAVVFVLAHAASLE